MTKKKDEPYDPNNAVFMWGGHEVNLAEQQFVESSLVFESAGNDGSDDKNQHFTVKEVKKGKEDLRHKKE